MDRVSEVLKFLLLAIGYWLMVTICYAGAGTTTMNFLKVGLGARPTALGETYTAICDDATSIYWNPAGLSHLRFPEVSLMYNNYIEGTNQGWIALAYPQRAQTFGLGINYLSSGDIPAYDAGDNPLPSVSASNLGITLSYARKLSLLKLTHRWGLSANFLNQRLDNVSASGVSLDMGMISPTPLKNLFAAFVFKNLGPNLKFIQEPDPLPSLLRLGIAYEPFKGDLKKLYSLLIGFDYTYPLPKRGKPYFGLGTELWFYKTLSVRWGYRDGKDLGSGLFFGFGFQVPVSLVEAGFLNHLRVDYALTNYGSLSNAHQINLNIRFGSPMADVHIKPSAFKYIVPTEEEERTKKAQEEELKKLFNEGLSFYNHKHYKQALSLFTQIISKDKTHAAAAVYLALSQAALERETDTGKIVQPLRTEREKPLLKPRGKPTEEQIRLSEEMYFKAVSLYTRGNMQEAIYLLTQVLKINPGHNRAGATLERIAKELTTK